MRGNSGSIRLDSWPTKEGQAWVSLLNQTYTISSIHTYIQPSSHIALLLPSLKSDYLTYCNPSCCPQYKPQAINPTVCYTLPLSSALSVHIKRQLSQRFLKQSYSKNGRLIRQLPILKLRVAKMVQVLRYKLKGSLLRVKEYYCRYNIVPYHVRFTWPLEAT